MIPGVTLDEALTCHLLTTIPADIVEAMTPQMRVVLSIQAARQEACRLAGQKAAEAASTQSPAARERIAKRAAYRAERSLWNEGGPSMARTDDMRIRAAGVDVPVRIHRPIAEVVLPAIVFLHGGGFTVGDLDTHDRIMRVLAQTSGATVIGVDYSLSPEAKFPQALNECAGVIDHFAVNGDEYGVDGSRLALAGDSAGASLILGAALLLRDDPASIGAQPGSFSAIRALLSFYGGHGLVDSASRRVFGGDWDGMGANDLNNFISAYFASPEDEHLPVVAHLTADLSRLPPVFVAAAGLDPLRDDSHALATSLQRAGNATMLVEYPHVLHSFLHFGRVLEDTTRVLSKAASFAADHLGTAR